MRLTRRQEMILDDGLGCGSSEECSLTNNLIEAIENSNALAGYKSKAFNDYYEYHKNEDCSHCIDDWWDEEQKQGTKHQVYVGILEMLVDLVDYSEYEDDKYDEFDNRVVYDEEAKRKMP